MIPYRENASLTSVVLPNRAVICSLYAVGTDSTALPTATLRTVGQPQKVIMKTNQKGGEPTEVDPPSGLEGVLQRREIHKPCIVGLLGQCSITLELAC